MWNDDELRGKADRIKGRAKDAIGKATGDERLRDEGAADEASGAVQETFGKARRKIGEAEPMRRVSTGLCVAAAVALAAAVAAQSQSQTPTTTPQSEPRTPGAAGATARDMRDITLTGCLQRGTDGSFTLTNVQADSTMASAGAGTATGATTAGKTGATGSTAGAAGSTSGATTGTTGQCPQRS